jgi:putative CocE/NonD family hydrolase
MTAIGRIAERIAPLPKATTRRLTVERELKVPMDDGVILLADHWAPKSSGDPAELLPVVLVRTAYGRGGPLGWLYGPVLAERGVHAVLVSSRGTFGSGGEFLAMRNEREDGLATLRWLSEQPWAGGGVILAGSSYFGYTQWAVADIAPPEVRAMVPHITSSRLALGLMKQGRLDLETISGFSWNTAPQARNGAARPSAQEQRGYLLRSAVGADTNHVDRAMKTLPLTDIDTALLGRKSQFFQEVIHHKETDGYWDGADHSSTVGDVTVPVSSVTGWYDIFLADQLEDFQKLASAGRQPRLTVGPWWHADPRGMAVAVGETVGWAAALARGTTPEPRLAVRLFVMGVDQWRDFDQWPPTGYTSKPWYLRGGGNLGAPPTSAGDNTTITYDSADPTPSLGGAKLTPSGAGPVDNRKLEERKDVLTFSSEVLDADLEVIGTPYAEIWLRTDRPSCDIFVRVCDVDERGKSVNIIDNLSNVASPNGATKVVFALSSTAHVFRRGHQVRVQVAGGAFPRYARNLGGGEAIETATSPHITQIGILHDDAHPSAVFLPARNES